MKKTILFIVLVLANSLLDSCATDDFFEFRLDLSSASGFSMVNYGSLDLGSSIAASDYAIRLDGSSNVFTSMVVPSFGAHLVADASYELVDKVKNISIISNADLNNNNPAGTELKELFNPVEIASHCINTPDASGDCLYNFMSYSYINSIEEAFNGQMAIGFVERPDGARLLALQTTESIPNGSHVFTIRFEFQSGSTEEFTTEVQFEN